MFITVAIVLIVLKALNVVHISWWWVVAPLLLDLILYIVSLVASLYLTHKENY